MDQGARLRSRDVRRGPARPPYGVRRTQALLREGGRPLGEEGGRGPSDEQAKKGTPKQGKTAEGVDANASKQHLYDVAGRLGIQGRSKMTKDELVDAIKKANRKATAKAR